MKRLTKFGDRTSYKPSEVLGLFILSFFGGMLVFGLCVLLSQLVDSIARWWAGGSAA